MATEAQSFDMATAAGIPQTEADLEAERRQAIIDQGITAVVGKLIGKPEITLNQDQIVLAGEIISLQLNSMSDRERLIFERRFGLLGDEPESMESLKADFGLTKPQVFGQIGRTLSKLRVPAKLDELRERVGIPKNQEARTWF